MHKDDLQKKYRKTLDKLNNRPVLGTIPWDSIEKLLIELGATTKEGAGSRVTVVLNGTVHVFHRPHPENVTDKGAVSSVKKLISLHFPNLID